MMNDARAAELLEQVGSLLADLVVELDDLSRGRRRTTTNAHLLSVAIRVRLHLARRGMPENVTLARIAGLEGDWLALLTAIERYRDLDGRSVW